MKTYRSIKKIIKNTIFFPYATTIKLYRGYKKRKIIEILSRPDNPVCYDSDKFFEFLQNRYPPYPDHGFDFYSSWSRGNKRALDLLKNIEFLRRPGLKILEACCGDGMTGYALQAFGHDVVLSDIDDWRHDKAKEISFIKEDLCSELTLKSEMFDFIFSFEAFEHVDNPKAAFDNLLRVCKKGGHIYLNFGPLYASPLGLHAFQTLRMPYPQYLFSQNFIKGKLQKLGIFDLGKKLDDLQPLNKWRIKDYLKIFLNSQCELVSFSKYTASDCLDIIMKYPNAFRGMGLDFEDVTVQALAIYVKKR